MTNTKTLKTPSDRTMNRLIVGAILVLALGIPLIGVLYVVDRYVAPPPPIVDQKALELEDAVRKTPNNLTLRLRLAGAYSASKRYDEAVAQFDEVLTATDALKPEDALGFRKTSHLGRGDARRLQGDLDGAALDYQAVVDLAKDGEFAPVDRELESAYFQLGGVALTQGRPTAAVTSLEAALAINHTDADTLHLLGQAYLGTGDAEKAVKPLREAVLFVPIGWCEPYATLGQAYTSLGRPEEATWASSMAAFCTDQTVDPSATLKGLVDGPAGLDALVGLGLIAEIRGDSAAAADWYRQAIAQQPDDFTASSGLSRVAPTEDAGPTPVAPPASPAPEGNS